MTTKSSDWKRDAVAWIGRSRKRTEATQVAAALVSRVFACLIRHPWRDNLCIRHLRAGSIRREPTEDWKVVSFSDTDNPLNGKAVAKLCPLAH